MATKGVRWLRAQASGRFIVITLKPVNYYV